MPVGFRCLFSFRTHVAGFKNVFSVCFLVHVFFCFFCDDLGAVLTSSVCWDVFLGALTSLT